MPRVNEGRAKGWMFTVNNPTDEERPFLPDDATYVCYQLERGEKEDTPHYQGYILFKERKRLSTVKALKFLMRAHLEVRRGTDAQAIAYCSKRETRAGAFVELGSRPEGGQGKKKALVEACELVRAGTAVQSLPEAYDCVRVRNGRGLRELQADIRRALVPAFRQLEVLVLWGPSGLGKTRYSYERFGVEMVFVLNQPSQGSTVWFDGYVNQTCLLIDDFEGWIPYRYLLKLLDGYPMELAVKGSFTPALYTTVVLTSNVAPVDWYRDFADMGAIPVPLARRITEVRHITENLFSEAAPTIPDDIPPPGDDGAASAGDSSDSEEEPLQPADKRFKMTKEEEQHFLDVYRDPDYMSEISVDSSAEASE